MTDVKPLPRFLSEREVAAVTGLGIKTLQKWRIFNEGPAFRKLGGAVRYSERDLMAWIESAPAGGGNSPRPTA